MYVDQVVKDLYAEWSKIGCPSVILMPSDPQLDSWDKDVIRAFFKKFDVLVKER